MGGVMIVSAACTALLHAVDTNSTIRRNSQSSWFVRSLLYKRGISTSLCADCVDEFEFVLPGDRWAVWTCRLIL